MPACPVNQLCPTPRIIATLRRSLLSEAEGLRVTRFVFAVVLAALAMPISAAAEITLDWVYAKEPPWGRMIYRVSWSPTGRAFSTCVRARIQAKSAADALRRCNRDVAGLAGSKRFGVQAATPQILGWSPDGTRVILIVAGNLYVSDVGRADRRRIAADVDDAPWSPRGDAVAYTHNADLYVTSLEKMTAVRRLTRGGVPNDLLNATLDWVYPEELGHPARLSLVTRRHAAGLSYDGRAARHELSNRRLPHRRQRHRS